MDANISKKTKEEVMVRIPSRYVNAANGHRSTLINQTKELLGYHPQSAIRALNSKYRKRIST